MPSLLIDMYLKLAEFKPGLDQVLLQLILPHEQKSAKVVSIGGELCMHRLVRHGDSHVERTGIMRRQLHIDGLRHS